MHRPCRAEHTGATTEIKTRNPDMATYIYHADEDEDDDTEYDDEGDD